MAKLSLEEIEEKLVVERKKETDCRERLKKQEEIVKKLEEQKQEIEKTNAYNWQEACRMKLADVGLSFSEVEAIIEDMILKKKEKESQQEVSQKPGIKNDVAV